MSATGATLSGSYSGATSEPSAAGFKYGTNSSNLNLTASSSASGTSGDLAATLTGLSAGTTYFYKAFVTVSGTEDYASQSETFYGTQYSFKTKAVATATVSNAEASSVGNTSASLNGSYSGATGSINATGFYYGTSSGDLGNKVTATGTATPFSTVISGLTANTTYYFKAYVEEYNENSGAYEERLASSTQSFTTTDSTPQMAEGWLELPAVTGSEDFVGKFYGSGGNTGSNRNYSYNYNYTYFASLWVAYPLCGTHKSGSGSTSSWRYNPNIDNDKQVNIVSKSYGTMYNASDYARGHQCPNASRKSDDTMNLHTYYSTNQTPQLQNKFNGSIWSSLETAVRNLVSSASDSVYVATGPVYRKVGGSETISYLTGASGQNANPSSLPIPNYYWKAILKVKRNNKGEITNAMSIGFWLEHREYATNEGYADFAVSVDQIEAWTGLDLFTNLPGSNSTGIEKSAESNSSWNSFQTF